jgi:hypothetical protein
VLSALPVLLQVQQLLMLIVRLHQGASATGHAQQAQALQVRRMWLGMDRAVCRCPHRSLYLRWVAADLLVSGAPPPPVAQSIASALSSNQIPLQQAQVLVMQIAQQQQQQLAAQQANGAPKPMQ